MLRGWFFFALLMNFFVTTASAQALMEVLTAEQEAVAIEVAQQTGRAIYKHDMAAAVATDAALKLRAFKKDKRLQGWVTEELDGPVAVTFIDKTPAALYRVVVGKDGAGAVKKLAKPEPLSPYEMGAALAIKAALAADYQPCSQKYNSVVLPADDGSSNKWVVYLIPGTTDSNVVPIGGTYRFEISNGRVTSQRAYTRTCIALERKADSVALMTTHLLDPIPTEVHVYWNLWAKQPLFVGTTQNHKLWTVADGKIHVFERTESEQGVKPDRK